MAACTACQLSICKLLRRSGARVRGIGAERKRERAARRCRRRSSGARAQRAEQHTRQQHADGDANARGRPAAPAAVLQQRRRRRLQHSAPAQDLQAAGGARPASGCLLVRGRTLCAPRARARALLAPADPFPVHPPPPPSPPPPQHQNAPTHTHIIKRPTAARSRAACSRPRGASASRRSRSTPTPTAGRGEGGSDKKTLLVVVFACLRQSFSSISPRCSHNRACDSLQATRCRPSLGPLPPNPYIKRHVALADEAYRIGPAPARESYLDAAAVLRAAADAGADAIHPG